MSAKAAQKLCSVCLLMLAHPAMSYFYTYPGCTPFAFPAISVMSFSIPFGAGKGTCPALHAWGRSLRGRHSSRKVSSATSFLLRVSHATRLHDGTDETYFFHEPDGYIPVAKISWHRSLRWRYHGRHGRTACGARRPGGDRCAMGAPARLPPRKRRDGARSR